LIHFYKRHQIFVQSNKDMDQEGGIIRRMPIGALQPGNNTAMVVAVIISKSDPRKVTMKKDGSERWVTTFTLRDTPSDMINMTIWSGREEAISLKNFHTGEVVEVVKPRIIQRDLTGRDSSFNPAVTSSLQLVFQDGKTVLSPFHGASKDYHDLLRIPSKGSSAFLSLSDIVTNSGSLKGHYVDILAAVRSVGTEKKFPSKDGEEGELRGVREVRLFDQTADCLALKLWDSETNRMAEEWIPREHILFLADVRIDYDSWKGVFVVTANSKTVITVNPNTREAMALARYAQLADFSSFSRLDQFVGTIDTNSVSRVANVMMVQTMCQSITQTKDSLVSVCLFGYITNLNIDCQEAVGFKCGACSGPFKPCREQGGEMVCVNIDCKEYSNISQDKVKPSQTYNVRVDVSDETGTLPHMKISQRMLERRFGLPAEFATLSDHTKTAYKWQIMFKPMKIILAMMLPTGENKNSTLMLVEVLPTSLEEITIKMPSPSI